MEAEDENHVHYTACCMSPANNASHAATYHLHFSFYKDWCQLNQCLVPSTLRIFFLCFEALLSMFRFTFGGFEKLNEAATACTSTVQYHIVL